MKIYGRNAVAEAIKSGNTIDRLVAAKGQKDVGAQRIIDDAKSRGIKVFSTTRKCLTAKRAAKNIRVSWQKSPTSSTASSTIFWLTPSKRAKLRSCSCSTEWRTLITSAVS